MDTLAKDTKLICIVGCARSGTTWLQTLLASDKHIASSRETYLFSGYIAKLWERWLFEQNRKDIAKVGIRHLISEAEYIGLMKSFSNQVIGKVMLEKPSASYFLDKTPNNIFFIDLISSVYPDTKFVHILRDPRAVAASMLAANRSWGHYWAPSGEVSAACMWRDSLQAAKKHYGNGRFLEIKYEDLRRDPFTNLEKIFQWVGLDVTETNINNYIKQCSIDNLREKGNENIPTKHIDSFLRTGTIDSWRKELTSRQIRNIEYLLGDSMEASGYELEYTRKKLIPAKVLAFKITGRLKGLIGYKLNTFQNRL